jgi:hypothetical protein
MIILVQLPPNAKPEIPKYIFSFQFPYLPPRPRGSRAVPPPLFLCAFFAPPEGAHTPFCPAIPRGFEPVTARVPPAPLASLMALPYLKVAIVSTNYSFYSSGGYMCSAYPRTPSAHPLDVFVTLPPTPRPTPETPLPTPLTAPPAALPTPATQPCTFLLIQLSFEAILYVGGLI